MRTSPLRSSALAALAYPVIGVVTGELSGVAASPSMRFAWRLAGWVLSFVVFAAHIWYERHRERSTVAKTARNVAAAAAVGAFILAAVGPVRTHWNATDFRRAALLSLAAWPLVVGIPAYVVALVVGFVLDRVTTRGETSVT